jgi:hypothetical protein
MKFCGIDLHSNNSVVVVTDETDRVLVSRRCPNELALIIALLDPHREGYPRTFVENLSGNCALVTESWSGGRINGRLLWTKKQSRKAVACP